MLKRTDVWREARNKVRHPLYIDVLSEIERETRFQNQS